MGDLAALIGHGGGFVAEGRFVARGLETLSGRTKAPTELPADPVALARAQGYAEGVDAALAEAAALAQAQDAARECFGFAFSRLDGDLAEELRQRLLDTVVALCEKTLEPLALDKQALAARVEKVVAMFARADDERVIRLHPDDLDLVRPLLPADWAFTPDPTLTRGALRVETQNGGAEDGPETWRLAIAEALNLC